MRMIPGPRATFALARAKHAKHAKRAKTAFRARARENPRARTARADFRASRQLAAFALLPPQFVRTPSVA